MTNDRRLIRLGLVGGLLLAAACTPAADRPEDPPPPPPQPARAAAVHEAPPAVPAAPAEPGPHPQLARPGPGGPPPELVLQATFWRESVNGSAPFSAMRVTGLQLVTKPEVGERVTLLPLAPGLPPLSLKIVAVEPDEVRREEKMAPLWNVTLEPVTLPAYQDAAPDTDRSPALPFDVLVIYPEGPGCRRLTDREVKQAKLPRGRPPTHVAHALDCSGAAEPSARAQLLEVHVCTDDPRKPECGESTAWEYYRWDGQGPGVQHVRVGVIDPI